MTATIDIEMLRAQLGARRPLRMPLLDRVGAAVMVPVVFREDGPHLLFTKRAFHLEGHAGEYSFPGGRCEPGDRGTLQTALREATEEIGIDPSDCVHLGDLDDLHTSSGYVVSPHVFALPPEFVPRLSPEEVAQTLEVPLATLSAQATGGGVVVGRRGFDEQIHFFKHRGEVIWGITAKILRDLLLLLTPQERYTDEQLLELQFRTMAARLLEADNIVLCTHVNPDGDGLGCQAATLAMLNDLGKSVHVVNSDQVPARFQFLFDEAAGARFREPEQGVFDGAGLIFVLDTGEWKRLGRVEPFARKHAKRCIVLDHHLSGDMESEGATVLARPWYSCAAEPLSRLAVTMGLPMKERYATPLYAALIFDTGGFRFLNGRSGPFDTASFLVRAGARAGMVQEAIFANLSRGRVAAQTRILSELAFEAEGRFVWAWVSPDLQAETGADRDEVGETISTMIALAGVHVAALIKEEQRDRIKISLRSKECCPVGSVAQALGGGGHAHACGAVVKGKKDEVMKRLRELVAEALEQAGTAR